MAVHTPATRNTYNLLILGETGVGKSTFINAFSNILYYNTFDEALKFGPKCLIPCKFNIIDAYGEEQAVESLAIDNNEQPVEGQSATQKPQMYTFELGDNSVIRVIDTPGVGDTRGLEQDFINRDTILSCLNSLESVHCICMIFKSSVSRKTTSFKFCIKEILTHLHRNATENIAFIFTHSKPSDFSPDGTDKLILKELTLANCFAENLLNANTKFSIDNDWLRYLYALNSGVQFNTRKYKEFLKSWKFSAKEVRRLIARMKSVHPYNILDSINLNNTRLMVSSITKPLAETIKKISLSIAECDKKDAELSKMMEGYAFQENVAARLQLIQYESVSTPLESPVSVCLSVKCKRRNNTADNISDDERVSICHKPCRMTDQQLRDCIMMSSNGRICKTCGCNWKDHENRTFVTQRIQLSNEGTKVAVCETASTRPIESGKDSRQKIMRELEKVNIEKQQMETEIEAILRAGKIFASFLKANALLLFNDALADYLAMQLQLEIQKSSSLNFSAVGVVNYLRKTLATYTSEVEIITSEHTGTVPNDQDVENEFKSLYELNHNGKFIKALHQAQLKTNKVKITMREIQTSRNKCNVNGVSNSPKFKRLSPPSKNRTSYITSSTSSNDDDDDEVKNNVRSSFPNSQQTFMIYGNGGTVQQGLSSTSYFPYRLSNNELHHLCNVEERSLSRPMSPQLISSSTSLLNASGVPRSSGYMLPINNDEFLYKLAGLTNPQAYMDVGLKLLKSHTIVEHCQSENKQMTIFKIYTRWRDTHKMRLNSEELSRKLLEVLELTGNAQAAEAMRSEIPPALTDEH